MDNPGTNSTPNRATKFGPFNRDSKYGGGSGGGGETVMPSYGVPFMNIMPQNLIEPTYGSQIYNPQVGAQLGSGVNPFFGPGGTLSGQFGQFLQPGFPAPGQGQAGTPWPTQPMQPAQPPTPPRPVTSVSSGALPPGTVPGSIGTMPNPNYNPGYPFAPTSISLGRR